MRFQGYIGTLPAGQPFQADSEEDALREMDALYDGMDCGEGSHLTAEGESLTVKQASFVHGDRVVTRGGKSGTVNSVAAFGHRVYVRLDDGFGEERNYDPSSLRMAS